MQESVFILGDKPTKLLPKARQVNLIPDDSRKRLHENCLYYLHAIIAASKRQLGVMQKSRSTFELNTFLRLSIHV